MPVTMSLMEVGTCMAVWRVSAPFSRMASRAEMTIMAKAFSWLSHATVMEVKPTPLATPSYRVLLAPEATMKPTRPLMAPERNMVRIMTWPTFIPA